MGRVWRPRGSLRCTTSHCWGGEQVRRHLWRRKRSTIFPQKVLQKVEKCRRIFLSMPSWGGQNNLFSRKVHPWSQKCDISENASNFNHNQVVQSQKCIHTDLTQVHPFQIFLRNLFLFWWYGAEMFIVISPVLDMFLAITVIATKFGNWDALPLWFIPLSGT